MTSSSYGPNKPRASTWEMIRENCPENEIEEVKRILGTSLVEQTVDLSNEVCLMSS